MGKAVDRFGQRKMLLIVSIALAATTFYGSFVSGFVMIFVSYFFLRYFGQGSMTLIPNSLVPQWFEKKRSFALGIATLGNLIATLTVLAFNYWLIIQVGWQNAWRFWSLSLLFVFVPLSFLIAINKPEDIGKSMDGNDKDADGQKKSNGD